MNEIMPYYNELYSNQEKIIHDTLENVDLYEDSTRANKNSVKSNSLSSNNGTNLFQDTPQGEIDFTNIEAQKWATNLTMNKNNISDKIKPLVIP